MERFQRDRDHSIRQQRHHLRLVHNWPREPIDCICDEQTGRFRKNKGRGCPKGRRCNCNLDKNKPTYRDHVRWQQFRDSLLDAGVGIQHLVRPGGKPGYWG